jgi:hypothetical protein
MESVLLALAISMASLIKSFLQSISISDFILILLCLAVAFLLYPKGNSEQKVLFIYKDGHLYGSYNLSRDITLVIDEHNTVEIKRGKARISYSDCPDKRCVKQGFNNNMPIICLPNRLVLEFKRSASDHKLILQ